MSGQSDKKHDQSNTDKFYHYTSRDGAKAIEKDGKISQSKKTTRKGDAILGEGVYVTKMDPLTYTKEEIAVNNYDGTQSNQYKAASRQQKKGKVDKAISLHLSKDKVKDGTDRDVYLHRGSIDINAARYSINSVQSTKKK